MQDIEVTASRKYIWAIPLFSVGKIEFEIGLDGIWAFIDLAHAASCAWYSFSLPFAPVCRLGAAQGRPIPVAGQQVACEKCKHFGRPSFFFFETSDPDWPDEAFH